MDLLFHHDVVVATLASGSRGNCTYLGDTRSGVLIDCGLSTRQILSRLAEIGLGEVRIDAILLTHEHSDHVGAAKVLDEKLYRSQGSRVPFFLTRGTRSGLDPRCAPSRMEEVLSGQPFRIGACEIEPYSVPHDTRDPVSYLVTTQGVTIGVLTDLGRSTRLVERQLSRMQIGIVEFNHDLEMLIEGSYPWSLKQRVRGSHGHLSNQQAAEMIGAAATSRLEHLVLAHLSEENNRPEIAREAAEAALHGAGLSRVRVSVASQQLPVGPIRAGLPPPPEPARPARRHRREPEPEGPPRADQLGLFKGG